MEVLLKRLRAWAKGRKKGLGKLRDRQYADGLEWNGRISNARIEEVAYVLKVVAQLTGLKKHSNRRRET